MSLAQKFDSPNLTLFPASEERMEFNTKDYCLENGIVSFSFKLDYDIARQKKVPEAVAWNKITKDNFRTYHNSSKNGFAILMKPNKMVVIDCDIKKAEADGGFPKNILEDLERVCCAIVKTPNGKHYYFTEKEGKPVKNQKGALWNGMKVPTLDIQSENALIYAPPSHYLKGDTHCTYMWERGNLSTMSDLPDSIFESLQIPETITSTSVKMGLPIEDILQGIDISHWNSYEDWLKIGLILFNEGYSCDVWDEYSKRSPSYSPRLCFQKWKGFHQTSGKSATIATLYYWLKIENPELFKKLVENIEYKYKELANHNHKTTSEIFHELRKDKYKFNSAYGWLVLQSNNTYKDFLKNVPDGFYEDMSNTVGVVIDDAIIYYKQLIDKLPEKTEDGNVEKKRQEYLFIMKGLHKHKNSSGSSTYLNGCIPFLKDYFNDATFQEKIDSKKHLFAFQDKVFDFEVGDFRPIEKTDYIMTTTGYNAPALNTLVPERLQRFLHNLFDNEETKQSLIDILAYTVYGGNKFQNFFVFKGNGGNGKGLIDAQMRHCLGSYYYSLPASYLTAKTEGKGQALPELAHCSSARMVVCSEPDDSEKLQVGFLKRISGEDSLTVRKLYCTDFTYIPQYKLFILLNDTKLAKAQEAIQRRIRVISFPFDFKSGQDYNAENPRHRLADPNLSTYLATDEVRDAFMALLLRTYIERLKNATELKVAPAILEATREYLSESNPLASWLYENFDTKAGDKEHITTKQLCDLYKETVNVKLTPQQMNGYMTLLGFCLQKYNGSFIYKGMKLKNSL